MARIELRIPKSNHQKEMRSYRLSRPPMMSSNVERRLSLGCDVYDGITNQYHFIGELTPGCTPLLVSDRDVRLEVTTD